MVCISSSRVSYPLLLLKFIQDPESQTDFTEQVVSNVTKVEPGHQCYKIASVPSTVTAGTNATIQLKYWADYEGENDGKNQTFYACADIVSPAFSRRQ